MLSTQRRIGLVLLALLLTTLAPAAFAEDAAEKTFGTQRILETLHDFYAASTYADIEAMDALIARGSAPTFIGTDPSEVFSGHDDIVAWWQGIFDFLATFGYPNNGGLPIVATGDPVQLGRRGSVAWIVDEPNFEFLNGTVPTRLTLVLRLEHGRWRIVQGHFSFGVPDADIPI